ncbi:MAG TPA: TIGR04076 family protein [Candidatus Limiplasma sp.]|nr:TIGR04076 family protein [Candidatus Limiplasma sp.]HPS80462.1 TIGR04076 family protein [Candidatus Limiplasma sp.]
MEDHPVRVVVIQSNCPRYQVGDSVVFEGAFVNKEKSDALCMVALSAIYPFAYAARRGGSVKPTPVQCPDCEECVRFQVERLD